MRKQISNKTLSQRYYSLVAFSVCCALCAFLSFLALPASSASAQPVENEPEGCTTITVGRSASADGSVLNSHTCDSHKGRVWLDVVPGARHNDGAEKKIYMKSDFRVGPDDETGLVFSGVIPEVPETSAYIWGFYPLVNEHQLVIGESTFGGKKEMRSENGMINCYELTRVIAERCRTAREAIALSGELLEKYGYNDAGECLTFADTQEVWHMEIVGPGQGRKGAVWAAQRVPDDHVGVNANSSRIRELELDDPDNFMASSNVISTAVELGLWDPDGSEPFQFCYAYDDRRSMASRRREWRVFDLLAPSLELDPNGENFPFSIKPEKKVAPSDIMNILADTYEGTEFDMTKFMIVEETDEDDNPTGTFIKSPYANPFMDYDQMPLWKINGGWGKLGERTLARQYCIYVFVSQSRAWLPDPIGGLIWFGFDNPAMTCYAPLYCSTRELPDSYRKGGPGGRPEFTRDSAWWAFNRVGMLASQRWGDMRHDVAAVRDPIMKQAFEEQRRVESEAKRLYEQDPQKAVEYLSKYSYDFCVRITAAYWKLGDSLWTKYDEKF